jgi:hypothetical protein
MSELTRGQKATVGWVIFSIFFMIIVSFAALGTGIYAMIEANKINNGIDNEISYIQKTFHDDQICLSFDQDKKVSFVKCNVYSNIDPYKEVSIDLSTPDTPRETLIQDNNEEMKINFQSGISIPGIDFIRTFQDANPSLIVGSINNPINTISINNPLSIQSTGAFIFGPVSIIDNHFPVEDVGSSFFASSENYRSYNLFMPGHFIETITQTNQRCNSILNLQGPSMYTLVKQNNDVVFCFCISSGSSRSELCSLPLIENAIILTP